MSYGDIEQRPAKKRRFFDPESEPEPEPPSIPTETIAAGTSTSARNRDSRSLTSTQVAKFDRGLIESIVGPVPDETIAVLRDVAGGDTERAINMYLDGSWQTNLPSRAAAQSSSTSSPPENATTPTKSSSPPIILDLTPEHRYIGAFGATAWATRSGSNLVKHGDVVSIERTKMKQVKLGKGGRPIPLSRQRADVIVRFTNVRGEEVGRLQKETAAWVSSLIDQKIIHFEGTCVFAPEKIRVNDTIYLQLRCYLRKSACDGNNLKPLDDNRATGVFEEKESLEEQALRLRQVAMVKLFEEVNLNPVSANETMERHKREGLLQAAEMAEQHENQGSDKKTKPSESGPSTPQSGDADEDEGEGKVLEQDQLDSFYKKAQSFDFNTPEREPADTFTLTLRKYQRQALHWMISKERDEKVDGREVSMHPLWEAYKFPTKGVNDDDLPAVENQDSFYVNPYSGELSLDFPTQEQHCRGGILADEMGLGKTIEMLSLIHTNRATMDSEPPSSVMNLARLPKGTGIEPAPCTTLVIAPMSLLAQWESEAVKASKPGTMKTLMYYGSEKAVNLRSLCCEANASTAPNIIITSYGVVLSEFNQVASRGGDRGAHGGLFSLDFFRVILDEAHFIKNRQSKTARACYELNAKHRWTLTGTPIVNRLEDLFSVVHFLRVEPWSNFSFWKTFITVPFDAGNFLRALDVVQTVLEPLVLRRTKDMKTPDGLPLVPLPPRSIDVEEIELSKAEQDVYDYIYNRAKRTFNANMEAGTVLKSYTTIFAQLLRLRQTCCHPILTRNMAIVAEEEDAANASDIANGLGDDMDLQELIQRFTATDEEQDANKFPSHVLKQIQDEANISECPICSEEPMIEPVVTGCWHSACKKCLIDYIEHQKNKQELPRCFNCREPINQRDLFEIIRHEDEPSDDEDLYSSTQSTPHVRITLRRISSQSSAKIIALVSHLKRLRQEQPTARSVVFSQFTSFLDLIGPALSRERFPYLRFDGSMNQKTRAAVLAEFIDGKRKGCVLLLSLRAGGVGLNLTAANNVFMMDPWWSFAVEAQAIDRVHRMGQESEVKVIRFVVRGSIEGKMLKIQERKKFIASSLGLQDEEKRLQRIEDLKELLS